MNSTRSVSEPSVANQQRPFISNSQKVILAAVAIITLVGSVLSLLAIISYVSPMTGWIGGGISTASTIVLVILVVRLMRSLPMGGYNTRTSTTSTNNQVSPLTANGIQQSRPSDHLDSFVLTFKPVDKTAYQKMDKLVDEGEIEKAWKLYLKTAYQEKHEHKLPKELGPGCLFEGGWVTLPPENLLNAVLDLWLSGNENIAKRVCPEFIRDCAIQYSDFRNKCLTEEKIWSCFTGYPEYVADIAAKHPDFGLEVMLSEKGESILNDKFRIEILNSSFSSLISEIKENKFDEQKIKALFRFLVCYSFVIHKEDYEKIKQVNRCFLEQRNMFDTDSPEYRNHSLFIALMDLVEGKLSFQGIYEGASSRTYFPPVDTELIIDMFDLNWIEEITRKITLATEEESIRKGIVYLSFIPQSSPHYANAQLMLGNVWLDLENYSAARECFLHAAERTHEFSSDALMLAAMSSLAVMKEEHSWVYILREDLDDLTAEGKDVRALNPEECKSLSLEQLKEIIQNLQKEKIL